MSADDHDVPRSSRGWDRRQLLRTSAIALGGSSLGWSGSALARDRAASPGADTGVVISPTPGNATEPFHGPHQAGVLTPAQSHLALLGLDLLPTVDREGMGRLLRLLSDDAARLTQGDPALADTEPELAEQPSRLTVTLGLGPRVIDVLLDQQRELRFSDLPSFATDRLRKEWGQTDLAIQICGDDAVTVAHARRMLVKDARAFVRMRWIQEGFRRARGSQPEGTTMRNVMGQVDGTVNLGEVDPDFDRLVWKRDSGPLHNGTFMVVRRIRARMDSWDRVDRTAREFAVGRRLDNGAPLSGTDEFDEPDFEAVGSSGFPVIDPASHIARARSADPDERMLRRSYNYAVLEEDGREDAGLVFIAFCADLERQFVPVQRRLATEDRLNEWVTTIGSAVYAVLPGASDGEWVGQQWVGAT